MTKTLRTSLTIRDDERPRFTIGETPEEIGVRCGTDFYANWLGESARFRLAADGVGWLVTCTEWADCGHDIHVLATREGGPVDWLPTDAGDLKLDPAKVYEIRHVERSDRVVVDEVD